MPSLREPNLSRLQVSHQGELHRANGDGKMRGDKSNGYTRRDYSTLEIIGAIDWIEHHDELWLAVTESPLDAFFRQKLHRRGKTVLQISADCLLRCQVKSPGLVPFWIEHSLTPLGCVPGGHYSNHLSEKSFKVAKNWV